ncbi:uncharacterized protein BJ171DRAFT_554512 [Polychytrium aggregatum]|uniref:uncharacterized protein n=1 Tax=Polychytrium aggregatum TaxID=110093 RepID=UPI0022FE5AAD|nr:uncharacterized protein BJ171DRAFT_554512 [Polychytrium aggregatum]KAI9183759.1 hypothetical protein BJ171DRAFT_554512 [Polychytrium aggregatum]
MPPDDVTDDEMLEMRNAPDCPVFHELDIRRCTRLQSLACLPARMCNQTLHLPPSLKRLDIPRDTYTPTCTAFLGRLEKLSYLAIHDGCVSLDWLPSRLSCKSLWLAIYSDTRIEPPIARQRLVSLVGIERIAPWLSKLSGHQRLETLTGLPARPPPMLRDVDISDCWFIKSLEPLLAYRDVHVTYPPSERMQCLNKDELCVVRRLNGQSSIARIAAVLGSPTDSQKKKKIKASVTFRLSKSRKRALPSPVDPSTTSLGIDTQPSQPKKKRRAWNKKPPLDPKQKLYNGHPIVDPFPRDMLPMNIMKSPTWFEKPVIYLDKCDRFMQSTWLGRVSTIKIPGRVPRYFMDARELIAKADGWIFTSYDEPEDRSENTRARHSIQTKWSTTLSYVAAIYINFADHSHHDVPYVSEAGMLEIMQKGLGTLSEQWRAKGNDIVRAIFGVDNEAIEKTKREIQQHLKNGDNENRYFVIQSGVKFQKAE